MNNGFLGGITGANISNFFEAKFGKKKTYYWVGIFTVLIGLSIIGIFLNTSEVNVSDYERIEVEFDDIWINDGHRSLSMIFEKEPFRYDLNHSMWKDRYQTTNLYQNLQSKGVVYLWIKKGESKRKIIRGLRSDEVFLDPQYGMHLENNNRKAGYFLGGFFIVLGLGSIISSKYR